PEKDDCPFPGLEPFEESLASYYFGRCDDLDELFGIIQARNRERCRWIQIEGPSGNGKSSFAQAGLIPAIRHRGIPLGPRSWRTAIMRPGSHPIRSLAQAMHAALKEQLVDRSLDYVANEFAGSETALANLIRECTNDKSGVLLVVDQFEELLTV